MNLIIKFVFLVIVYEKTVESLIQGNILNLQSNVTNVQGNVVNKTKYMEPKIVGGVDANFNGIEHIVSLRLWKLDSYKFGRGHICGGTLLNSTTIVTAAHCFLNLQYDPPKFRDAAEFKIVMGTLNKSKKTTKTFESYVKKIVYHQKFSIYTMENDIGLMILSKPVPSNNNLIKTIPLSTKLPPINTKCRIDGWGAIRSGSNGPNRLQTVNITILDQRICNRNYRGRIKNGMFCAGNWNGGQDSCQGDSGGPLTCDGKLVGVVSWGDYCAFRNFPGIYTDVAYFENWIRTANSTTKNIIEGQIYIILFFIIGQFIVLNKLFRFYV